MQAEHRAHLFGAAQLELAQPASLFDPTKHLVDPEVSVDRLGVALVASGAPIDGGTTGAGGVLGHVRGHADVAHLSDKAPGVVVLVGTNGFLVGTGTICCHRFGRIPFSGARGLRDFAIHDQGMPVVHQHMAPIARLGWVGVGFPGKQGVWIRRGAVRGVAELDASKVALGSLLTALGLTETLAGA